MSEAKHTPGPWLIWRGPQYVGGGEDICIGRGDQWLANMDHRQPRCPQIMEGGHLCDECDICTIDAPSISKQQLTNARLMSAAPDLLAACKQALANLRDRGADYGETGEQLISAIAAAESEE